MRYSLIIPHYGNREMLQRLLDTVPDRDDLEVLVIHDDNRQGAGWARNQALKTAKGDYLIFADSDDWFLPTFNKLLDDITDETADIIFFNATSVEEGTSQPSWRTDRLNWIFRQSAERREFLLRHTFTEPWCHIVKRSLIKEHDIKFDETPILNDVTFTTQCGYHAETCSVYDIKAYCVCNRNGSTAKQKSDDRMVVYAEVMAKTNAFNRQHGINYYHARMIRPLLSSLLKFKFGTAKQCWHAIRHAGFPATEICCLTLSYPIYAAGWLYRRICYERART